MSTTTRDAPNPLRPYYIPPSVGLPPDQLPPYNQSGGPGDSSSRALPGARSRSGFSSSARGILSDLDYGDYLSDGAPSAANIGKQLLDQALWKYTSVLLAQPFEVAKTILQCHLAEAGDGRRASHNVRATGGHDRDEVHENGVSEEDESETDELAYFTPSRTTYPERSRSRASRHAREPSRNGIPASPPAAAHRLELRRPDSLLEVIAQLWQKEGAWGVWKGANASFIYSVLLRTIESWTRSLLAALLNAPDPGLLPRVGVGGVNVADSSQPLTSLGIAVAAAGIAGILLVPLDIIRTRLILTPTSSPSRSIISSIQELSLFSCPPSLLPVALIHSTLPTLITSSTPLMLRSRLGVDPVLSPTAYSILTFVSATVELFIRLPLETVLRRGQANIALRQSPPLSPTTTHHHPPPSSSSSAAGKGRPETIVAIGPYKGIAGTVWSIMFEEGSRGASGGGGASPKSERDTITPVSSSARARPTPGMAVHGPRQVDGVNGIRQVGGGSSSSIHGARHDDGGAMNAAHAAAKERRKQGQGMQGLWRGWRVGMWGLVGMWGANAFGGGNGVSEF